MKDNLLGAHLVRIENTVLSGIPDVACCLEGRSTWIELKIIHSDTIRIRPSQVNWFRKYGMAYGEGYILCCIDENTPRIYLASDIIERADRNCFNVHSKTFNVSLQDLDYLCGWPNVKKILIQGFTKP
jgi:Holliday junction resolvase